MRRDSGGFIASGFLMGTDVVEILNILSCDICDNTSYSSTTTLLELFTMTTTNSGFFPGARNFTVSGGVFAEVHGNYVCLYLPWMWHASFHQLWQIVNLASEANQIAPLPPMKQSSILFTGHDSYLKVLEDHFGSHSAIQRKSYLLYGIGGIGKTQICLKFIEKSAHL